MEDDLVKMYKQWKPLVKQMQYRLREDTGIFNSDVLLPAEIMAVKTLWIDKMD